MIGAPPVREVISLMRFMENSLGSPSSSTAYRTNDASSNANPGKSGSITFEPSAVGEVGIPIESEVPCLGTAAVSPCEASPKRTWIMFTEMGAIVTFDELPPPAVRNQGICIPSKNRPHGGGRGEGGNRVIYRLTHGGLSGGCWNQSATQPPESFLGRRPRAFPECLSCRWDVSRCGSRCRDLG